MGMRRQHQDSDAAYQKKNSGCMQGFFQFFDFYQRLRGPKMISDRNHGVGKSYAGIKTRKSFVPSTSKEHDFLESETNITIGNKGNTTKRSGKGSMRALFSKKLARRCYWKQKMLPATPQLLRTISIHHLECNDYVPPDQVASDREPSTIDFGSHGSDSSATSEHVPLLPTGSDEPIFGKISEACEATNTVNHVDYNLVYELGDHSVEKEARLVEKITEAKDNLSKQKHVDTKGLGRDAFQSRDFINLIGLFKTDRELFLKILEDQNFAWENFLPSHHSSHTKEVLTKSGSFPGTGLSGGKAGPSRLSDKQKESEFFVNQERESQLGNTPSISKTTGKSAMTSKAGVKFDNLKSESATLDSSGVGSSSEVLHGSTHELKGQRDNWTVLNHFKDLKQRIQGVVNKNKKENYRISMDGILHKVPYGQKVTKDVLKEKLYRSASARCDRDGPRDMIGTSANRHPHQSIRRSHSLTESLDRYSHLLESNSRKESKRLPESLKSRNEDDGLHDRKTMRTFGRIFSNPEFLGSHSFSKDVQSELFHAVPSSEVSATRLLAGDVAVNIHNFLGPESVGTLNHAKQIKESATYTEHSMDVNVGGITDRGVEHSLLLHEHDQIEKGPSPAEDTSHNSLRISKQPVLISEHDQNEIQEISDITEGDNSQYEQESGTEMDPTNKQGPISVLDSFLKEDPVTPAEYLISEEDPELEPRSLDCKELDDSPSPENPLDADVSNRLGIIEPSAVETHMKGLTHVDALHIQVDPKYEAEFNYVRDVLKKSGFFGGEFLGTWCSPSQQVDPLLPDKVDGLPNEPDIATDDHGMSLDHELLDLIHEVLLDIYETSFPSVPWFSCSGSQLKLAPVVYHVLREVWAKVSWHLSSQKQLDYTLESIMARDFAKNDGWLNLQWDVECVGMELEDQILDNLLNELIFEVDVISNPPLVSY